MTGGRSDSENAMGKLSPEKGEAAEVGSEPEPGAGAGDMVLM